jgi:hypothetical protein
MYVNMFGTRYHGNDGNVFRKNPGGGAFGPNIDDDEVVVVVSADAITVDGKIAEEEEESLF